MEAPTLTSAAPPAPSHLTPVAYGERIVGVDVVRGFALLGILLVNMSYFGQPFQDLMTGVERWPAWYDHAAEFAVTALAEGKFYILFSTLFGLGMAIQMGRSAARGAGFAGYYVRRLLVLLAIGAAHALLFWYGDILHAYALLGFLLLAFRKRHTTTIVVWSGIFYLLSLLVLGGIAAGVEFGRMIPEANAQIEWSFAEQARMFAQQADAAVANYAHGTWTDMLRQRITDLSEMAFGWMFMGPTIAAMFLLGLFIGRAGVVHDPAAHRPLLWGFALVGLPLGLALNVAHAAAATVSTPAEPSLIGLMGYACLWAGAPLLSAGYACTLLLLLQRDRWRPVLAPLASVGRMALSNYLLQTLICTTIFYGYGLGLYAKVGPAARVGLALLIYAAQIPLSVWWLRRFRFGPMEWLWRTLTYWRLQPMRL